MSRVIFREERCKGCLLCTLVCPTDNIEQSQRTNKQGYRIVQISNGDMSACKGCGFCAQICPDEALTVYRSKADRTSEDLAEEEHV